MATKYLQYFPKPLLDDLVSGRWLPVLGAGMSVNARLPLPKKMPLWPDLGRVLGAELADFASNSTLDTISAYQHEFGRAKLVERLTDILFIREAQPGEVHKAFCSIPFDIVCTTNFDFLLERQYDATPRYAYPVVDEEQLSVNIPTEGTLLLKLHGDLRHPGRLVVTEGDYDAFLAKYPLMATYLSNQLITKTAILIGYSLDDPDFRQIWKIVADRLGRMRRMAYSVMVDARASDIARFERRGVKVINLPGAKEKYGEILTNTFDELREYMRDNVISVSQVTEEEPLRELLLPRSATTRLCFFSIPLELLSLYRSLVFPMVEEIGFVPVTAVDVVSPGDNINAKIDALIDRASVMVVDLTSQWTRAEYEMARARTLGMDRGTLNRQALHIIVVTTEPEQIPAFARRYPIIRRDSLLVDEADQFVEDLASQLREIAAEIGLGRDQEPHRLYASREYGAAVISALTLLEASLRRQFDEASSEMRRPLLLRDLLDLAVKRQVIQPADSRRVREWMKMRNEVVHMARSVSPQAARQIVDGVSRMLRLNQRRQ